MQVEEASAGPLPHQQGASPGSVLLSTAASCFLISCTTTRPCGKTNMPDYFLDYFAIFRQESSRLASAEMNLLCEETRDGKIPTEQTRVSF